MSAIHRLDEFAHIDSPLSRWDLRYKIVALLTLIVAIATTQTLWLLIPIIAITGLLYALSRLPWSFLRERLTFPGYFIAAFIVFMPLVVGENIVATLGPISIRQEGVALAILVAVRFTCILTLAVLMFGTDSFLNAMRALRALRFPDLLADMVLLTYRYLFEIGAMFAQLRVASRVRGMSAGFSLANARTLASLLGHMLVRSYEQSERVYKAMVLRGYGTGSVPPHYFQATRTDLWKSLAVVLAAIVLILIEL